MDIPKEILFWKTELGFRITNFTSPGKKIAKIEL